MSAFHWFELYQKELTLVNSKIASQFSNRVIFFFISCNVTEVFLVQTLKHLDITLRTAVRRQSLDWDS